MCILQASFENLSAAILSAASKGDCSAGIVPLAWLCIASLPAEPTLNAHATTDQRWTIHPLQERLKKEAKRQGLWNLWLPAGGWWVGSVWRRVGGQQLRHAG